MPALIGPETSRLCLRQWRPDDRPPFARPNGRSARHAVVSRTARADRQRCHGRALRGGSRYWRRGGEILAGSFVGRFAATAQIEMRFQCLSRAGLLLSGQSLGVISMGEDGRQVIDFVWSWLDEVEGNGCSRHGER